MSEKKFVITDAQKELLLWNLNNHSIMDAKWIIRGLPEFVDQEELIAQLKKEIEERDKSIADLIDKLMGEK